MYKAAADVVVGIYMYIHIMRFLECICGRGSLEHDARCNQSYGQTLMITDTLEELDAHVDYDGFVRGFFGIDWLKYILLRIYTFYTFI